MRGHCVKKGRNNFIKANQSINIAGVQLNKQRKTTWNNKTIKIRQTQEKLKSNQSHVQSK